MNIFWEVASESHAGNVRTNNEDALLIHPQGMLWAVADGMGGYEGGDTASAIVVEELGLVTGTDHTAADLLSHLRKQLRVANNRIQHHARTHCEGRFVGSTVVCLLSGSDTLACAWAGDSRLYRLRGGELQSLSTDHSEVAQLVALGMITAEEAKTHPKKNVITRTIGAGMDGAVEVRELDFQPGDVYLLCSDGLYNELDDAVITTVLQQQSVTAMAAELIHRTLQTPAKDNASCIVLRGT